MKELQVPEFKSYEEEAAFWDDLDTADFMPDDDEEWFRFDTPQKRAVRIAILPEIAHEFNRRAHQGVSIETLVNVLLTERIQKTTPIS